MNAEETARAALDDLQGAIADLAGSENWDTQAEILHDIQAWLLRDGNPLNAADGGYLVTLDRRIKDEDAAIMRRFLLNIVGVIAVDPVPDDAKTHIAERRALYRMKSAIEEAIHGA